MEKLLLWYWNHSTQQSFNIRISAVLTDQNSVSSYVNYRQQQTMSILRTRWCNKLVCMHHNSVSISTILFTWSRANVPVFAHQQHRILDIDKQPIVAPRSAAVDISWIGCQHLDSQLSPFVVPTRVPSLFAGPYHNCVRCLASSPVLAKRPYIKTVRWQVYLNCIS